MTIATLKTVILAKAGIHAEFANSQRTLSMGPRWREDDAVNVNLRSREESLPHKGKDISNVSDEFPP